ncbi:hypothetical protein [Profundibacter sp.]
MKPKDWELTKKVLKLYEKDMKRAAIYIGGLSIYCLFFLWVDKYYSGTALWWGVAVITAGGFLYVRIYWGLDKNAGKKRALELAALKEEAANPPRYNGPDTSFYEPESERHFALKDVLRIEMETTGNAPFDEDLYWIFYLQSAAPVRMAGPVAMGEGIFTALKWFVGADIEKAITAAATVDHAFFQIWERSKNA